MNNKQPRRNNFIKHSARYYISKEESKNSAHEIRQDTDLKIRLKQIIRENGLDELMEDPTNMGELFRIIHNEGTNCKGLIQVLEKYIRTKTILVEPKHPKQSSRLHIYIEPTTKILTADTE